MEGIEAAVGALSIIETPQENQATTWKSQAARWRHHVRPKVFCISLHRF
jgi:hypothetical protein